MSDAAFKIAKYPGYTTAELQKIIEDSKGGNVRGVTEDHRFEMADEIARRAKVKAGDVSVMTDRERLRHVQATGRTLAGNDISGI